MSGFWDKDTNTTNQNGFSTDRFGTTGTTNDGKPPSSNGVSGTIYNPDGSTSTATWNGSNQSWDKTGN